jgi:hypothetical protein
MPFKEIIAVYSKNHTELTQITALYIVKTAGIYNYHYALKV